ncbi:MAG: AI-2E family transporter [Elusimicrobiales bacterium]|nr:AI-2E family transporter [Elusimicrobiales bacterium]
MKEIYIPLFFVLLFFIVFYFARKTFMVVILSISFSYLLNPIVKFFEVRGIKRSYVVGMLYICSGTFFLILAFLVFDIARFDIDSFFNQWPIYYNKISIILDNFFSKLAKEFPFILQFNIRDKLLNYLTEVPVYLMSIIPYFMILFIVPFISFFILIKGTRILDILVENIPSRYVEVVFHIVSRVDHSLGNYLRGIITDALILSFIAFFGLFFMNINYYSVIAMLVGISCLVPYVGAFVGAFVSCIIAFLQYGTFYSVLKVLLFFVFLRFIDDWFIQPYIIQKSVNLNPAVVVLALMAGGEIAGFWGVVFAVPFVCIIREFLYIAFEIHKTLYNWKFSKPLFRINIPYT